MGRLKLAMLCVGLALMSLTVWRGGNWQALVGPSGDGAEEKRPPESRPPDPERVVAEGRLVAYPGAEVVVGSEMPGKVVGMYVAEKSVVRRGDLIAELRSDDLRATLAEAEAQALAIDADVIYFDRENRRSNNLRLRGASSPSTSDNNRQLLDSSRARLVAARANRDHRVALLDKSRIVAPIDGVVVARYVHAGQVIEAARDVVKIVDLSKLRVEAEVDEFDTGRVKLGDRAIVQSEGFAGLSWEGRVEEIPDVVVARRISPDDPSRPVDTRVLMVKIALTGPTPLKVGQRLEVAILPGEGRAGPTEAGPTGPEGRPPPRWPRRCWGASPTKVVTSDRHRPFEWIEPAWRQICWSHLERDFQAMIDRGGAGETTGRILVDISARARGGADEQRAGTRAATCRDLADSRSATYWTISARASRRTCEDRRCRPCGRRSDQQSRSLILTYATS